MRLARKIQLSISFFVLLLGSSYVLGNDNRVFLTELLQQVQQLQQQNSQLLGRVEILEYEVQQLKQQNQVQKTQDLGQILPAPDSPEGIASADYLLNSANDAFLKANYEKAVEDYRSFTKQFPNHHKWVDAMVQLGYAEIKLNELIPAIDTLNSVVTNHPEYKKTPEILLVLADLYQKTNNSTAAKLLYRRLVEEYPQSNASQTAKKHLAP